MGNVCCNNAKDDHNLNPEGNGGTKPLEKKDEPVDPELIKKAAENEDKIVKI